MRFLSLEALTMHCHPKPLPGSANKRKLDAPGNELDDHDKEHCGWSHILVPGELKSNPREDNHSPHGHGSSYSQRLLRLRRNLGLPFEYADSKPIQALGMPVRAQRGAYFVSI
jgi:hypothetical protein